MARPAGIVKSNPEKVNVNDIADVAQNHYDKILSMLDYDDQEDENLRNKLKIAVAVFTKQLLDTVDSGVDPRDIMNRINEWFKK